MTLKKLVAAGLCLVVGVQVLAMLMPDRRFVLVIVGVAVALVLLALRWYLARGSDDEPVTPIVNDAEESLRRWLSRTETLISWSESTRSDWDRHLRPMLARQFGIATGSEAEQESGRVPRHRPDAVRRRTVGLGGSRKRRAHQQTACRVRAGTRSTKYFGGWSRYDPSSLPAATTTANCEAVLDEIQRVVVGKRWALTLILTSVLARGHVLIEDLPGLGKTLIARSFAAALGLEFTRVQFTPDLLPADLLGSTVYDMQSGRFEFRVGADLHQPAARR